MATGKEGVIKIKEDIRIATSGRGLGGCELGDNNRLLENVTFMPPRHMGQRHPVPTLFPSERYTRDAGPWNKVPKSQLSQERSESYFLLPVRSEATV